MKSARYHGPRDVRIEDVSPDQVNSDEVRIEVSACGICGSDLNVYQAEPPAISESPHPVTGQGRPLTLGHEVGGVVTETGDEVAIDPGTEVALNPVVWCGECRYCLEGAYNHCKDGGFIGLSANGGFAENVVVSAEKVVPLTGGVSPEIAALVEPFTVGVHAVRQSPISAGDSVAIYGAGPIGLTLIQTARVSGAGEIFVSEPRVGRRDRARECGADVVIDPERSEPTEVIAAETGDGVDISLEAVGIEATINQAIRSTTAGGWTTVVGLFEGPVSIQPDDFVMRERVVSGSAAYRGGPLSEKEFGTTIRNFATGDFDPELLVTDRITLGDVVTDGFERLSDPESVQAKVLVTP